MTEENKYLDTLFQSKFAAFEAEPPAQVWNNIHTRLQNGRGGSINPVNLATIAALVLITGLLSFSLIKDAQDLASQESPEVQTLIMGESGNTLAQHILPASPSPSPAKVPAASATEPSESEILNDPNVIKESSTQTDLAPSLSKETWLAKLRNRRASGLHADRFPDNTGISLRNSPVEPKYFGQTDAGRKYNRKASWQLGLLFTPSVSFYPDDSILNQRTYTFDASVKWLRNEFFIESGLGLSFSSDDGRYNIGYEKFLGSYDDVYNVTFDTLTNGTVVPTYHTNLVNVYDSVSRYKVEKTKNHYTYLQIPLYVGFQKQTNRFGWFVKGGPVFSLLIKENIAQPDAGNDRIVGLDQQMAGRVNSYWQFALSAGLNYQLSNRVSIAIEPTFRYYLNSQYDRKYINTRHPYSIGLRTGLLFNF